MVALIPQFPGEFKESAAPLTTFVVSLRVGMKFCPEPHSEHRQEASVIFLDDIVHPTLFKETTPDQPQHYLPLFTIVLVFWFIS